MTMLARLTETLRRCRMRGGMDDEQVVLALLQTAYNADDSMCVAGFRVGAGVGLPSRSALIWAAMIDAIQAETTEPAHTSSELGHG